ncbi:MAG: IMPACT family protein [Oscillospiraceae bacterium]|nr:IMPACT family protein [Oscillospiraceae bacterium]
MTAFRIPTAPAETEFTEKRSRFIGHVWPLETEEKARANIEEMKKRYHDARHNCWCYAVREGNAVRYSDDGEPQGTAGQPMLGVFQKEGVEDFCCVVTRYFGGILLGAGGLVRAYTRAAKDTLDAAGISEVRRWTECSVTCPYHLFERVKLACADTGIPGDVAYGTEVTVHVLLPEEGEADFIARITELTAGGCVPKVCGTTLRPVPLQK